MRWLVSSAGVLVIGVVLAGDWPTVFPIRNLRTPVERYEKGALKTRLTAAYASAPMGNGDIEARDVVIERLARDGVTVEFRVEAEQFSYDRDAGKGICRGPVLMNARGLIVSGDGLEWHQGTEMVAITSNAQVVIDRALLPVERITL